MSEQTPTEQNQGSVLSELARQEVSVPQFTNPIAVTTAFVLKKISKSTVAILTLLTEIAIVLYIGSIVGSYFTAKTIQADCASINFAKVGESYIQCTPVLPKKDAPTVPPR